MTSLRLWCLLALSLLLFTASAFSLSPAIFVKYPAASYHTVCSFFPDGNIRCSVRKGFNRAILKDWDLFIPWNRIKQAIILAFNLRWMVWAQYTNRVCRTCIPGDGTLVLPLIDTDAISSTIPPAFKLGRLVFNSSCLDFFSFSLPFNWILLVCTDIAGLGHEGRTGNPAVLCGPSAFYVVDDNVFSYTQLRWWWRWVWCDATGTYRPVVLIIYFLPLHMSW